MKNYEVYCISYYFTYLHMFTTYSTQENKYPRHCDDIIILYFNIKFYILIKANYKKFRVQKMLI